VAQFVARDNEQPLLVVIQIQAVKQARIVRCNDNLLVIFLGKLHRPRPGVGRCNATGGQRKAIVGRQPETGSKAG